VLRVAMLLWSLIGTVLAGIGVVVSAALPGLLDRGAMPLVWSFIIGFAAAVPAALVVARAVVGRAPSPRDLPGARP